jgi:hypothetical protein
MATMEPPKPIRPEAYNAALDRVMKARLFDGQPPDASAMRAAEHTLGEAMEILSGQEPDRYASLYAEVAVVGAFARARYGEDPLSRTDLKSFHQHLARFLNSWVHRHGER